VALPLACRDRDPAQEHQHAGADAAEDQREPGADVRLNRFLALAGLGTRRSVERLARSGRIAIDGTTASDPAQPVHAGAAVTLDGHALVARSPCGVLVRAAGRSLPPIAHPASLHVAGVNDDDRLIIALDDARLAAKLLERGYDPGRLIAGELAEGAFRPLSPAELTAADVFARRPATRRPHTL
jgi:hypothetical protein